MMKKVLKNKKMIKKSNKGITLVALVVTIIVLLILTGISVNMLSGDNGIIENSGKAKVSSEILKENEILGQAIVKVTNEEKSGNLTLEGLTKALKGKDVLIEKNGKNYKVKFNNSSRLYKITYKREIQEIKEIAPTEIWAKQEADGTLRLRSTYLENYELGTKWNSDNINKVIIEEPIAPKTCSEMFENCTNLVKIENIKNLHTENSKSMYYMFYNCNNLEELDLSCFDTSQVTTMRAMFGQCHKIKNLDLSNFNTQNVTNIINIFYGCNSLISMDLSGLDTKKITGFGWMFRACSSLTYVNFGNIDTSNVTDFGYMFGSCGSLKSVDISCFNMEKAKSLNMMFNGCTKLENIQFGEFNICNVTDTNAMFRSCSKLSDETLNDVLNLLPKGTKIEDKTLKKLEIPKALVNKCTTLSNYNAFLEAGWTTGY